MFLGWECWPRGMCLAPPVRAGLAECALRLRRAATSLSTISAYVAIVWALVFKGPCTLR